MLATSFLALTRRLEKWGKKNGCKRISLMSWNSLLRIFWKKTFQKINLSLEPISYRTAYLMAVWGFLQSNDGWKAQDWVQASILKLARHPNAKSAEV
jgi:hypothetical protein